jgi:hypothetical protein
MSVAVDAIVLITLRERRDPFGQRRFHAVGMSELADVMQVSVDTVNESVTRLEASNDVVVKRIAGIPFWAAAAHKGGVAAPRDLSLAAQELGTAPGTAPPPEVELTLRSRIAVGQSISRSKEHP